MTSPFQMHLLSEQIVNDRLAEASRERLADQVAVPRANVSIRFHDLRLWLADAIWTLANWLDATPLQQDMLQECPALIDLGR